ncbi:MAG: YgiT-type zinc finger protein [Acidobacteria bacterium]|nr:YgiT-type zinc finger protein [Acidobacteriota bacterium]
MENSQKNSKEKEVIRTRCSGKCPGAPEPGRTTQIFQRRGSPVKVTIRHIPAAVCPLCHESYVSRETGRQIDLLLEPFHGRHERIPALPPAEVTIDFAEATAALKAA